MDEHVGAEAIGRILLGADLPVASDANRPGAGAGKGARTGVGAGAGVDAGAEVSVRPGTVAEADVGVRSAGPRVLEDGLQLGRK